MLLQAAVFHAIDEYIMSQTELFERPLPDGVLHRPSALSATQQKQVLDEVLAIDLAEPFQHVTVPMGGKTSAAITNCGPWGWWADKSGYRYEDHCPTSGKPWPEMPACFFDLLAETLSGTPAAGFKPDACLINRYAPDARMGLHRDMDETDFSQPIITWSLGLAGDFLIGGTKRKDKTQAIRLDSGDMVVMHGPGRMLYHGVRKVFKDLSPLRALPEHRISLTFRRAR